MALKKKIRRRPYNSEEYKEQEIARLAEIKEQDYQRLVEAKLISQEDKEKYFNPITEEEKNQAAKLNFILAVDKEIASQHGTGAFLNFKENFLDYEKKHKGASALSLIKDDFEKYTNESFSTFRLHDIYSEQEKRNLVTSFSAFTMMPIQEKESYLTSKNQKNAELEAMLADKTPLNRQYNSTIGAFAEESKRIEQTLDDNKSEIYKMLEEDCGPILKNLDYYHQHLEKSKNK